MADKYKNYPDAFEGPAFGVHGNVNSDYILCARFVLPRNAQTSYGINVNNTHPMGIVGGSQITFMSEADALKTCKELGFSNPGPYLRRPYPGTKYVRIPNSCIYLDSNFVDWEIKKANNSPHPERIPAGLEANCKATPVKNTKSGVSDDFDNKYARRDKNVAMTVEAFDAFCDKVANSNTGWTTSDRHTGANYTEVYLTKKLSPSISVKTRLSVGLPTTLAGVVDGGYYSNVNYDVNMPGVDAEKYAEINYSAEFSLNPATIKQSDCYTYDKTIYFKGINKTRPNPQNATNKNKIYAEISSWPNPNGTGKSLTLSKIEDKAKKQLEDKFELLFKQLPELEELGEALEKEIKESFEFVPLF